MDVQRRAGAGGGLLVGILAALRQLNGRHVKRDGAGRTPMTVVMTQLGPRRLREQCSRHTSRKGARGPAMGHRASGSTALV